jgi:SMODS and SLOG-associating 2TM effector domain 1/SMODS and SLOG-associating 2TM effector domain 3
MMSVVLVEDHLPGLYAAAERMSADGQRQFRRYTGATLVLLVVAAACGLIERAWAGWISASAFGVSLVLVALREVRDAQDRWYDGRAAAESVKSTGWKYAVGGAPFNLGSQAPDERLRTTLTELVAELRQLRSELMSPRHAPDLAALRALRSESLWRRQELYGEQRLAEQRAWYARRAGQHRTTARRLRTGTIALQALGVGGAALKGLGVIHVDLLPLFATSAASGLAWLGVLDVQRTARSYDFAALELEPLLVALHSAKDESAWAKYVADAEAAMSREHTMWLARKQEG